MAEYPRINQSPFFKTFPRPRRSALFPQNPTHRPAAKNADAPNNLQHYPLMRSVLGHGEAPRAPHTPHPQHMPHTPHMSEAHVADTHAPTTPEYVMPNMPDKPPVSNALISPNAMQQQGRQRNMLGMPLRSEPSQPPPPTISPAEHFQNVNARLPDGVRYEPLDDDIKTAMLALNSGSPPKPPQVVNQANQINQANHMPPHPEPAQHASQHAVANPTEQLRKVNKGLPDGIRYEPYEKYDEETKAALQALNNGTLGKPHTTNHTPPEPPPVNHALPNSKNSTKNPSTDHTHTPSKSSSIPIASPETEKLLERLIQDERNASVYYQYLAEIAPKGVFQTTLVEFIEDCGTRLSQYQNILQNLHGRTWEPKNPPINTNVGFDRGVEIAVIEENKILRAMAELLERIEDDPSTRSMQKLLNKRIIQLNWLQWALFRVKTEGMRQSY